MIICNHYDIRVVLLVYLKKCRPLQAVEILRMDYEPSDMDILYAEGISSSNSLMSMEFSFPESIHDNLESIYEHDLSMRSVLL